MVPRCYRIIGADRNTGADRSASLWASSPQNAEARANTLGILVSQITCIGLPLPWAVAASIIITAIVSVVVTFAILRTVPQNATVAAQPSMPPAPQLPSGPGFKSNATQVTSVPNEASHKTPAWPAPKPLPIQSPCGPGFDSLKVSISTITSAEPKEHRSGGVYTPIEDNLNDGFERALVCIDRKAGLVRIEFDYDRIPWLEVQTTKLGSRSGVGPLSFLVRFFDKNGQYLTHFTTAERYYVPALPEDWLTDWEQRIAKDIPKGGQPPELLPLDEKGNWLEYRISTRDAAFVWQCELGWALPPSSRVRYLLRTTEGKLHLRS